MLRNHTWKARRDAQTWRSRNKVTQAPFQIAPPYFLLSLLIDYIRDEYVHTSVYLVNPMSPLVNALTSFDPDINVRQRHDRLSSDLFDENRICQNCIEFGSFSNPLVIPPQKCAPGLFAQNLILSLPICISKSQNLSCCCNQLEWRKLNNDLISVFSSFLEQNKGWHPFAWNPTQLSGFVPPAQARRVFKLLCRITDCCICCKLLRTVFV